MIQLVIASAVRVYRESLAEVLPCLGPIEVVGSASSWTEVKAVMGTRAPSVVLIAADIVRDRVRLPELLATAPTTKIIVAALRDPGGDYIAWIEAGAHHCIPPDAAAKDVARAVLAAARDEIPWSPEFASLLVRRVRELFLRLQNYEQRHGLPQRLTRREMEVIALVSDGISNKAIARQLGITVSTTKNHLHSVGKKLGVGRRAAIMAWYRDRFPASPRTPK